MVKKRTKMPSQRQLQAGELVRRVLVDILAREDFRDPDLKGVSITISEAQVSPDLRHARVFAAPLGGTADTEIVIKALNRASKFLRGCLGREMTMRSTPALHFEADTTFQSATDMQVLMSHPDIIRDLKKSDEEE